MSDTSNLRFKQKFLRNTHYAKYPEKKTEGDKITQEVIDEALIEFNNKGKNDKKSKKP